MQGGGEFMVLWGMVAAAVGGDRHRNPAEILWLGENTGLGAIAFLPKTVLRMMEGRWRRLLSLVNARNTKL